MLRMVSYELKKLVRRPFTIVVSAACLLFFAIMVFVQMNSYYALVWSPTVEEEWRPYVKDVSDYFGENVGMVEGHRGVAYSRQRTAFLQGEWDDARTAAIVAEYQAALTDEDNYESYLDEDSMYWRGYQLAAQGLSEEEIATFNEMYPIRKMKPEFQYGEWPKWSHVSSLLEGYLIDGDGNAIPLSEAFPQVKQPATYAYAEESSRSVDFQGLLGPILCGIMLLVGLSPLFADEVVRGTEPVLLATKNGRSRLTLAKILAGLLFAMGCLVAVALVNLLMTMACFGADGLAMALQLDYYHAGLPFATSIVGYFALTVLYQLVAVLGTASVIMVLSAVFSSIYPPLFLGVLWYILVPLLGFYGPRWVSIVCLLLPPSPFFTVLSLASGLVLFGVPVWLLGIASSLVVTLLCSVFLYKRYRLKR